MQSIICNFIKENPNNWVDLLQDIGISIKQEGNLAIFNYAIYCDFSNPIVQEARGIIIDTRSLKVVCWPFKKFGNYNESYADEIDWATASVQEKVDGSIIKAWFYRGCWRFSTNSVITPTDPFDKLIKEAVSNSNISFSLMDTNNTYIFELVGPENQVVVHYEKPGIYHLGTRNNATGQEYFPEDTYIGVKIPKRYNLGTGVSLEDCVSFANILNGDTNKIGAQYEGFVVCDKNFHRIKIKTPEYVLWHHRMSNRQLNDADFLDIVRQGEDYAKLFADDFPYVKEKVEKAKKIWESISKSISELLLEIDSYKKEGLLRKDIALRINSNPFKSVGFSYLDKKLNLSQISSDKLLEWLQKQ